MYKSKSAVLGQKKAKESDKKEDEDETPLYVEDDEDMLDNILNMGTSSPNGKKGIEDDDEPVRKVAKATRKTRVYRKLNAETLRSRDGIPELLERAKKLRFKGPGHEDEDAEKLLNFFRLWSVELFPKMPFIQFIKKSETICRSREMKSFTRGLIRGSGPMMDDYEKQFVPSGRFSFGTHSIFFILNFIIKRRRGVEKETGIQR